MISNIAKRVYYSEFLNKIKKYKGKENKIKLAVQKCQKIIKTNEKMFE
jgi:hypothetical protein